jgi:hypothetical protein
MPSGQPAITGEGFNWGYFIGCGMSTGAEGDGPNFKVLVSPNGFHIFDAATPWSFSDYYNNMLGSPVVYTTSTSSAIFLMNGVTNYYQTRLLGTVVTLNDGSSVTIASNTYTTGTAFSYSVPANPPTSVTAYSGMHLVT